MASRTIRLAAVGVAALLAGPAAAQMPMPGPMQQPTPHASQCTYSSRVYSRGALICIFRQALTCQTPDAADGQARWVPAEGDQRTACEARFGFGRGGGGDRGEPKPPRRP